MSVKISWNNKREYEKIHVYRSESKIELDALPTVLSEVAGDATFYVDIEAKNNTVYHYRLGKVSKEDGIERFSENQTFGNFPETGHGWPTIIRGTWESGYYGTLTETELFTFGDIINKLNERLTVPLVQLNLDSSPVWHKVIYDGKILFFPNGPIGGRYNGVWGVTNSIDWRLLYKAGAVYGTDGPGPLPENIGFDPVDQDLSITKDGRTYRIRLPKIFNSNVSGMLDFDDVSNTFEEGVTYTDFRNSEYSSVINAIRRDSKLLNDTIRLGNEASSSYTSNSYGGIFHRMLSQDLVTKGSEISAIDIWDVTVTAKELFAPTRASELDATVYESLPDSNAWWPVLELILD